MEIGGYYFSKIQTITLAVLILGLVVGLTLVQREQNIKSRAAMIKNTFEVYQHPEQPVLAACSGETCSSETLGIIIKPRALENQPRTPIAAVILPPAPKTTLANCLFTRTGQRAPFGSTILLGWLEDTARRYGVPPAVLASLARHESEWLTTVGNDNDSISSNYFCNTGSAFCQCKDPKTGGAYNAYMGSCSQDSINAGCRTGRAMGLMQVVDIQNPDLSQNDLCTITTNIERGTQVFISKLSGPANNEAAVKRAVCRYWGNDATYCNYGGGDYAGEVWQDYLNCPAGQ